MKKIFVLAFFVLSAPAFANINQYPVKAMENAVARNSEIQKLTQAIATSRGLKCTSAVAEQTDLQAMKLNGYSEFETRISCNAKNGGADRHLLTFKGYTYGNGQTIEAEVSSMKIETFE